MKPTIHMNGSGAQGLLNGYRTAAGAVSEALAALESDAAPNARDYYPQGSGAFSQAVDDHQSRQERLRGVLTELHLLAEHCADAVSAEADRKAERQRYR